MEIVVKALSELPEAATRLLEAYPGKRVFLFYGPMGVGKTTLIKVICEVLGVKNPTSSPTFSIVNEYLGADNSIFHFDFYRIRSEQEAYDMGYEEYFYSGSYCFVEWPEKIASLLPEDAVRVELTLAGDGNRSISANDPNLDFET